MSPCWEYEKGKKPQDCLFGLRKISWLCTSENDLKFMYRHLSTNPSTADWMLYNSPSPKQGWNILVSPQIFYSFHFWNQLIDSRSCLYITLFFCFLKNNFVFIFKAVVFVSDSCSALFEPFAITQREVLICVLNKTGVGKSWCELSSHTSLQPRICLRRGPIQNVVGLLCSNFTDIIWL